jgi:surface polysaccharide O-acyltransferase-like enzyme
MFAKMRMPEWLIKFVKFAGPCSFAIYVINCQSLILDHYFKNGFRSFGQKDTLPLLLSVFGSALLFVAGAIIVDRIRIALFKAMHVSQFTAWVEKKFRAFFGKICEII